MSADRALAGAWVVVTGASSGLGREVAERLAEIHGANLILVARRAELLESLSASIRAHGVQARVVPLDLATAGVAPQLMAEIDDISDIAAVVLCAGVTYFGAATDMSGAQVDQVNALNVSSTALLLLEFSRMFEERGLPGRILIISSMAALIPLPFQAAYSASKSYVRSFVAALRVELARSNISFTMAYPLGMDTEMTRGSGLHALVKRDGIGSISVTRCADRAISDLIRRKPTSLVGAAARILYLLATILPDAWLTKIAGRVYRDAWLEQRESASVSAAARPSGAAGEGGHDASRH